MKLDSFVVIDTETTGLMPSSDRVIEIGAIFVEHNKIKMEYQKLIRSVEFLPSIITTITGIDLDSLMTEGFEPELVFKEFRPMLGNFPIVAHNISFDLNFLNSEFVRYGLPIISNTTVCTLETARRGIPELMSHKLTNIKSYLGLEFQSHRALSDAYMCLEIIKRYPDSIRIRENKARRANFSPNITIPD